MPSLTRSDNLKGARADLAQSTEWLKKQMPQKQLSVLFGEVFREDAEIDRSMPGHRPDDPVFSRRDVSSHLIMSLTHLETLAEKRLEALDAEIQKQEETDRARQAEEGGLNERVVGK